MHPQPKKSYKTVEDFYVIIIHVQASLTSSCHYRYSEGEPTVIQL